MTSVTIHTPTEDSAATQAVELPADLFDVALNVPLIHQVVVAQQAAARQGTHDTKSRGEVRGGGKKPYRQKGTGRARQGSTRAPQFTGGGVVHGPTPRSYEQRTPKKMKAAALRSALSDRARGAKVHVVESFVTGDVPSTRDAVAALTEVTESTNVLVVLAPGDLVTWKSLRNVPTLHLLEVGQLNTYDVLVSDDIVFTKDALAQYVAARTDGAELVVTELETKPAKKASKKAAAKKAAPKADDSSADSSDDDAQDEKPAAKKAARKLVRKSEVAAKADSDDADGAEDSDAPDYGPDSHLPLADGSQPEGFPVKGNADSMLYHVPDSPFYERTEAEVWFKDADAAEAAGFALPPSQRDDEEDS